jgi:H+/Cl- antiporter ClcA
MPTPGVLAAMLLAGAVFGFTARGFVGANHAAGAWMKRHLPWPPMRALTGGAVIAGLAWAMPLEPYLGLGLPGLVQAFEAPRPLHDFAAKAALTIGALASGFKGGEVTPLFWIGASLGSALAPLLALPVSVLAGLGLVAVFAGAAKAPVACTIMAMELFGARAGLFAAIACAMSGAVSGSASLYRQPKDAARDAHN